MTTGNNPAQPNPNDPTVTDDAGTTQPQAVANAAPVINPLDHDQVELQEALAAAEAEEAAANGTTGTDPAAGKPAPLQAESPAQTPSPAMIPKPRLDEALRRGDDATKRADEAARLAAYWQGVAEGRTPGTGAQPGTTGAPGQPAQPTSEQRLSSIQTEIDALATRFDNGEITMAEFKKQERALDDQRQSLREDALLAKVKPAAAPGQDDELYLNQLTAQLEDKHPWVQPFDKVATAAEFNFVKARAIENLVERGIDPLKGRLGTYELRKEMAGLMDTLGPSLIGAARLTAAGIPIPGQAKPAQAQQPGQQKPQPPATRDLSRTAQANLTKIAQSMNAPPNLNDMSGNADNGVTESAIEQMTDDEIAALPPATLQAILGTTRV